MNKLVVVGLLLTVLANPSQAGPFEIGSDLGLVSFRTFKASFSLPPEEEDATYEENDVFSVQIPPTTEDLYIRYFLHPKLSISSSVGLYYSRYDHDDTYGYQLGGSIEYHLSSCYLYGGVKGHFSDLDIVEPLGESVIAGVGYRVKQLGPWGIHVKAEYEDWLDDDTFYVRRTRIMLGVGWRIESNE
ncbi:MAG: hypothetical protein OXI58_04730 [Gemmatimonadota bacterium]|nr:hypothetical protein [Gemmatimonadota bacterium]